MADDEHPTDGGRVRGATVGERLADEVRRGELSSEDVAVLRTRLGFEGVPDADPDGGVEARLRHLQSEVASLAAYAEAVEPFLDEHGTARRFVADAREDIDGLERRLDAVDARATRRAGRLDDLEGVARRQGARLDRLEAEVGDLGEAVGRFDDRLAELERAVAALRDWRAALGEAFDGGSD